MPFTETGKEKAKREAYMKANKERGIRQEKQREYEMFGTTEQNLPTTNPMGDVVSPSPMGMKKGGSVSASKRADGCAIRGKTKGITVKMCGGGYAKGKK